MKRPRKSASWFEVDKEGLSQLMKEGGAQRAVLELVSNAFDEKVKRVDLSIERNNSKLKTIRIEDDSAAGFRNLDHAYTLFAYSTKKGDEKQRGRFNLGEKLVLALCENATIVSTSGTVTFGREGREINKSKRRRVGTIFTCEMQMSDDDMEDALEQAKNVIIPQGVRFYLNKELIKTPPPVRSFLATLPTVKADGDGNLRTTSRQTTVELYRVPTDETSMLFELGIPVVEVDCKWHINVCQKVPLNFNRDNVTPAYLSKLLALVLNESIDLMVDTDMTEEWVREASASSEIQPEVMAALVQKTFGGKVASFDPRDPESSKRLAADGYKILYGASLSKGQWENVKRDGLVPSSSSLSPTNPERAEGSMVIPKGEWTEGMRRVGQHSNRLAQELLGVLIDVVFINNSGASLLASYGKVPTRVLTYNVGRLGKEFFEPKDDTERVKWEVNSLLIHELAHEIASDHLSERYYSALSDLGAKLAHLGTEKPQLVLASDIK